MENKYHKLSYSKYFELAAEGCILANDSIKDGITPESLTEAFHEDGFLLFVVGYILGKGYSPDCVDKTESEVVTMSDILIKQYFEEALANG